LYNLTWHTQLAKDAADGALNKDDAFDKMAPNRALWSALTLLSAFLYWVWIAGGLFTWQMPFYSLFLVWSFFYGKIKGGPKLTKILAIADAVVSILFILFVILNETILRIDILNLN
jgi:hypothetical protein